jgi:methyl-accepting chemotaxis protein
MTANAVKRVSDAVERLATNIEKAADESADRLNKLSERSLNRFHDVEKAVADPLEAALNRLDELVGKSTNNPPA